MSATAKLLSWSRRIAPAFGLFLLAPLTAEYLTGYDSSTGDFGTLLAGLLILSPLYGGAAIIIRESARRAGRGWPTMLLLGVAFGVVQAGLVDQSLFSETYRDIDYWEGMLTPTYIPALGFSASMALTFIVGHAIWSIGVPIAVIESFVPRRATTPWLGGPGLVVVVMLYLAASALIYSDHATQADSDATPRQLIAAAALATGLIVAAFALGGRYWPPVGHSAPDPWRVGAAAFGVLNLPLVVEIAIGILGYEPSFESTWWGFGFNAAAFAVLAYLTARWSRRAEWGHAHRLALAGAALMTNACIAFLVDPIGDVAESAKLAHNTGFLLGAMALLALAARSIRAAGAAYHTF